MRERALKTELRSRLAEGGVSAARDILGRLSPDKLLNPLISLLCSTDELTKFRAVELLGEVVGRIADREMEDARVVMRRFMWMLNDESGGIGWGAPEAMAESMVCHRRLAGEYAHILVANMREDGNFLELPLLQRGLIWGIGRLSEVWPQLMESWNTVRYLLPYLGSADAVVRGRAAYALGVLKAEEALTALEGLLSDAGEITIYQDRELSSVTVGLLAGEALHQINP